MFKRILFIVALVSLSLVGCKSKKTVVKKPDPRKTEIIKPETTKPSTTRPTEPAKPGDPIAAYVEQYRQYAMDDMVQYKIPASITLAQGILESGSGSGRLAREANNHFGIKCHDWKGERIYHDDDALQECFRKYSHAKYSFRDHSLFLTQRSRYRDLFNLSIDDYKGWARGLRRAGYATDPNYPTKLISLIERYNLQQYDQMVIGKTGTTTKPSTSAPADSSTTYTVQKGDTLYSISRRFNVTVDAIKKANNMKSDAIGVGEVIRIP